MSAPMSATPAALLARVAAFNDDPASLTAAIDELAGRFADALPPGRKGDVNAFVAGISLGVLLIVAGPEKAAAVLRKNVAEFLSTDAIADV